MEINNIYQNQYKTDVKMSESFNAFWARNGVKSKDDVVKVLIYSVFDLLNSDLAKSVSDANANQTVLDRTEFRDLMEVMTKIIGKYINTDTKNPFIDQNTTTTRLRELIVEEVVKCISQVGDELKEKSKDRSDFI